MNHIKFALSSYTKWLTGFATILGVIAYYPPSKPVALGMIFLCFIGPFLIPLTISWIKKDFSIKTLGNSKVSVCFGDLFEEDCFLITTNRHFDVVPDDDLIAKSSLLGFFVKKFYGDDVDELKQTIKDHLELDDKDNIKLMPYGTTISFRKNEKLIYFMAFTDRKKSAQPKGFYLRAMNRFLNEVSDANHGKTIAIPLLGDNNNLSNSGFANSAVSLESLISTINSFGIENPQVELKLKIVILPEKRSELIGVISNYSNTLF